MNAKMTLFIVINRLEWCECGDLRNATDKRNGPSTPLHPRIMRVCVMCVTVCVRVMFGDLINDFHGVIVGCHRRRSAGGCVCVCMFFDTRYTILKSESAKKDFCFVGIKIDV